MSRVIKCDGTNCNVTVPIDSYDTDARDWFEVVDRMESFETKHYHSLSCLYTFTGGTHTETDGTTTVFEGRLFTYRNWS